MVTNRIEVEVSKMRCPLCRSADTGKVGSNQYYCWQCLMEFKIVPQQPWPMFYVEADGSLIPFSLEQSKTDK
ncbi:MAG: hypothetical protein ACOX30_07760 [Dethiobacteria bacterium]|jgi:hypothetical protein